MALDTYKISQGERDQVYVGSASDILSGTVAQNKETFDKYPDLIKSKLNDFIEYVGTHSQTAGDAGLSYTLEEISTICTALGCTEADITM